MCMFVLSIQVEYMWNVGLYACMVRISILTEA